MPSSSICFFEVINQAVNVLCTYQCMSLYRILTLMLYIFMLLYVFVMLFSFLLHDKDEKHCPGVLFQ